MILVIFETRLTGLDLENLKRNQLCLEHFLQTIKSVLERPLITEYYTPNQQLDVEIISFEVD